MTGAARVAGVVLAGLLLGCPGKDGSPTEPADEARSASPGEAKAEGADEAEAPGGLVASVQEQVDAVRKAPPESAAPPVVEPGAPLLAVVNGVPIPKSAFDEIYALKAKKYEDRGRTMPPSADRRYRKSIAERLVHHERIRQRAVELGVEYDPADLAEREQSQRRGIRDWTKHLERRGETEQSLRDMIIAELRERAILDSQGALAVSRAELESDYDKIRSDWTSDEPRVRAAHILVSVAPPEEQPDQAKARATAKAEAERLHGLATAPGADFAQLAREHSTGPSASKGGDIGIFTRDRMVKAFSDAAFALAPGEISVPIETKFGFHVVKSLGKWPAGELPLAALEDQIIERLKQRKLHKGRREMKDELETAYPVTHHLLTAEELAARPSRRERGETKAETKMAEPAP